MKKALIITLFIALVLGVFTACNGDVFEDLINPAEPAAAKTITLEIPSTSTWDNVSFSGSANEKTKVLTIPANCETWEDFLNEKEVKDNIKVYITGNSPKEYTLKVYNDERVFFMNTDKGKPIFGLDDGSKGDPYPKTVSSTAEIIIGGTYTLTANPQ